jgi:hypothetical protein
LLKKRWQFGDHKLLNNRLAAILQQPIAKQAMPFGNHLSLKKAKVI